MALLDDRIRATKSRPQAPESWSALGVALLEHSDVAGAEAAFTRSVQLRPTGPGLRGWAECAARAGDLPRAVGLLTVARSRGLLSLGDWLRLGELAAAANDLAAATLALATYTRHAPEDARGWLHRAIVCTRSGSAQLALPMLDRAIALDPQLVDAHANRAVVLETLSRLSEAEHSAQKALEAHAGHPLAVLCLARVLRRQQRTAEARTVLLALPDDRLTPSQRSQKYADLGQCADQEGEIDTAWEAFGTMNRHAKARPAVALGQSDQWEAMVGLLAEQGEDLARFASTCTPPAEPGHAPVFVMGFPRSGTTLLERLLGAHPQLVPTDEPRVTDQLLREWPQLLPEVPPYPTGLHHLDGAQRHRLREAWHRLMRAERPGIDPKLHIIDKVPLNLVHLPLLHAIFPESPKVVLLRDPRDSALSCFMQDFAPGRVNNRMMDMDNIVRVQARAFRAFAAMRDALAEHLHILRYEDLTIDHTTVVQSLLTGMGFGAGPPIGDHRQGLGNTHITTPSYARVTQPVDTTACQRWHRYAHHLRPWRPILDQTAQVLGYDTVWPSDSTP